MILDLDHFAYYYYHTALIDENVIEVQATKAGNKIIKQGKFTQDFIDAQNLSDRARKLRDTLIILLKKKFSEQKLKTNMEAAKWSVSDEFDVRKTKDKIYLPNYDILAKDINEFFGILEFRTNQLGVTEILSQINNVEISNKFLEYYDTDPKLVEFLINDFIQGWKGYESVEEKWLLNAERSQFITELKIKISKPKAVHKTKEHLQYLERVIEEYGLYYYEDTLLNDNDLQNIFIAISTKSNILSSAKIVAFLKKIESKDYIFLDLYNLSQPKEILKLVDAFRGDEFSLLVLSYKDAVDNEIASELFEKLKQITQANNEKKIIFITSIAEDAFLARFEALYGYKKYNDEKIALQLKDVSKILAQEITIQDQPMQVSDFIENDQEEKIKDASIIDSLINSQAIAIGKRALGTVDLEGAYYYLFHEVNAEIVVDRLHSPKSSDIYIISGIPGSSKEARLISSLKNVIEAVGGKSTADNLKGHIAVLNQQDMTRGINQRIQVSDDRFNKEDFKHICRSNPERKIYWIHLKNEDNEPKCILEQAYNPDFYLQGARFNKQVVIKKGIREQLVNSELSETFVIWVQDESEFIRWLLGRLRIQDDEKKQFESNCNNQKIIFLRSEDSLEDKFQEIIGQNKEHTFHLLKFEGTQLIWYRTRGSLKHLSKYRAKDDREIEQKDSLMTEVDVIQEMQDKKVAIIAGDPGLGKSTTLTKLYESKDKQGNSIDKSHWVIRANLKNYLEVIRAVDVTNSNIATEFLSKVDASLNSDIAKSFLSMALVKKNFAKPLLIAFDGFDEVLDKADREKIIFLLKHLKDKTEAKFWITTRLHYEQDLEGDLSTFAIRIDPMDHETTRKFIKKYLKDRLSLTFSHDEFKKDLVTK